MHSLPHNRQVKYMTGDVVEVIKVQDVLVRVKEREVGANGERDKEDWDDVPCVSQPHAAQNLREDGGVYMVVR